MVPSMIFASENSFLTLDMRFCAFSYDVNEPICNEKVLSPEVGAGVLIAVTAEDGLETGAAGVGSCRVVTGRLFPLNRSASCSYSAALAESPITR